MRNLNNLFYSPKLLNQLPKLGFFIFKTARFHVKKPSFSLLALVLLAMVCGALCLQKHRNRFAVCAEMRNFAGGLWKRYS
jgi:hypothetical protein